MSRAKQYRDDECRKCGGRLDTTGQPQWCAACRQAYHRAYNKAHPARAERAREYWATIPAEKRARYREAMKDATRERTRAAREAWDASRRERGLLTYAEVAVSLSLAVETLRLQVKNGALHPATRERGQTLFATEEVERYRRESRGQYGWTRPDHPLYDVEKRVAYLAERRKAKAAR